ncbi:MAG TPA: SDR family NAD(P)-dependent oxidoreductase [Verrucomicrobiae bacterium]|nr:SDR family NAD(P)-dependent oxidoreductase [Verrucomicrobiae bacterium]
MSSRIILITGANGGLGQAIARAFLAESPSNFLCLGVHTRRDGADALATEFPARCECIHLDVTRAAAWQLAIDSILQNHKRIDVLVNNAGRHDDSLLATMTEAAWESVMTTNLDATFLGCQAVIKPMIAQRGGRIVNIASLSALLAPAGQTNYAAAKAGVVALTQSLAKEVARIGITVNAVCPGYIATEALSGMGAEERQAAQARIPMRRFGKPEEVAAVVRFLACADASYVTGSVLKVDGGIF